MATMSWMIRLDRKKLYISYQIPINQLDGFTYSYLRLCDISTSDIYFRISTKLYPSQWWNDSDIIPIKLALISRYRELRSIQRDVHQSSIDKNISIDFCTKRLKCNYQISQILRIMNNSHCLDELNQLINLIINKVQLITSEFIRI